MSEASFNVGGLRFWNNDQINTRERVIKQVTDRLQSVLLDINQAWRFERVDTPVLVPRSYISAAYSEDDIFLIKQQLGDEDHALRAETTAGSYLMAEHILKNSRTKPPLCVWQAGQSFRVEKSDGASPSRLRFNAFYQLEFQMIYSEDTKADYVTPVSLALAQLVEDMTGLDSRLIDSDRLPSYSVQTQDIEVELPESYVMNPGWREVASMSQRTDFPEIPSMKKMKVFEVAFGLDRLVSIIHKTV
jgi:glycyl-tRNA synthetase